MTEIEIHKKIKELVDIKGRSGICVDAEMIAKELQMDADVVKDHLAIMEIDQYLAKPDNEEVYCNNEALVYMLNLLGYEVYLT